MSPRILVIEADEDLQLILRIALESGGYEVISALSAEDGRAFVATADLVLLDVRLPGLSGLELLAELAAQPHGHPPIVVMSAHGDRRVADEATQLGALEFVPKPCNAVELPTRVRAWLHAP